MHDEFPDLPDDARLWVFGVDRTLTTDEERALLSRVDGFLEGWRAHGHPLSAARAWKYRRFLLVAVDERHRPPSGCSIDALVRILKELETELGVSLLEKEPVWYRAESEGEVRRVSRADFRARAQAGTVEPGTMVFDPSVTRVGELRRGGWERPAAEGWHRRFFPREVLGSGA